LEVERPRSSGSRIPPLRSTDEVGHDLPVREAEDAQQRVGWQPSRFLADRAEAERAFALAEQLGSVNAAPAELGTTWPSLRKAFTRHGLGMPARNPEAVRQRAIAAAATAAANQPRRPRHRWTRCS
jgi:hypothetical protein